MEMFYYGMFFGAVSLALLLLSKYWFSPAKYMEVNSW